MSKHRVGILYIDSNPLFAKNQEIVNCLERRAQMVEQIVGRDYDVWRDWDLHFFDKRRINHHVDLLITHLKMSQVGMLTAKYDESLEDITKIHKDHPSIPIIVYTGASEITASDETICNAGAAAVFRKKDMHPSSEEVESLKKCIDDVVKKYNVQPRE